MALSILLVKDHIFQLQENKDEISLILLPLLLRECLSILLHFSHSKIDLNSYIIFYFLKMAVFGDITDISLSVWRYVEISRVFNSNQQSFRVGEKNKIVNNSLITC